MLPLAACRGFDMIIQSDQIAKSVVNLFSQIQNTQIDLASINTKIIISDTKYQTIARQTIEDIYSHNVPPFSFNQNNELTDCDDFSLYLKYITTAWARQKRWSTPPAVGLVLDRGHAFNLFIESNNGAIQACVIDLTKRPILLANDPNIIENSILQQLPIMLVYF